MASLHENIMKNAGRIVIVYFFMFLSFDCSYYAVPSFVNIFHRCLDTAYRPCLDRIVGRELDPVLSRSVRRGIPFHAPGSAGMAEPRIMGGVLNGGE